MVESETKAKLKRRFNGISCINQYNRGWRSNRRSPGGSALSPSGWLLLAALLAAPHLNAQCTYSVLPLSLLVDAAGTPPSAPRSFTVTTQGGCPSNVSTTADWIQIVSPLSGIGSRTVQFHVRPNPGVISRSGTVQAGTATLTVFQGANCSFSLSVLSTRVPAAGVADRTIQVTAPAYCERTAFADEPWISVRGGHGFGSGNISFSVAPNGTPRERTGRIVIVNRTVVVTQDGANCAYRLAIDGAPPTLPATGGNYPLLVETECEWTLRATVAWMEIGQLSGRGSTRTNVVVLPNEGLSERSGQILAPAGALTVVQAGRGCAVSAEPASVLTGSAAFRGVITVQAACPWTAQSDAPWLRITGGAQAAADGSIQYAADENTDLAPRTGVITIRNSQGPAARITIQQASRAPLITTRSVVSAASFQGGSVSPGELMTVFGLNLGPVQASGPALSADGKFVLTELAGVRVLVDGMGAPLTYADSGQVNFIVPYAIAGRPQVEIRTQYHGLLSEAVRLPVVSANPEIFTASGGSQGAILNQDGQPNSRANPARRGSVIQIFATGFGVTLPSGIDGYLALAAPWPEPVARVRAFVAGQECRLLYAGAAPGLVSGVMQVNCELPLAATGSAELSLLVGDRRSRGRATVSIE